MKIAEYLRKLKPQEISIEISSFATLEIFKHDKINKYSAKLIVCNESNYIIDRFDYIKYYNFDYLKKKLIKEYGRFEYKN